MFYDHRSISIGYAGKQVSNCGICLLIDLLLGLGNGLDFPFAIATCWLGNYGLSDDFPGFVNDNFTKIVSCSMDMFGYLRFFLFHGLNTEVSKAGGKASAHSTYRYDKNHGIFLSRKLLARVRQYRVTNGDKHEAWRWIRLVDDL
jgi:hypothetical protein